RIRRSVKLGTAPIYLNSPMAVDATRIYHTYRAQHRLSIEECTAACQVAEFVNTPEASKALNEKRGPMIIMSASGMATGGRVVHHLKAFAPDPSNLVLFSGFQAGGTRGAAMVAGAETIRIHGQDIPVRAEVANLEALSAHADYAEILDWLKHFKEPPRTTYLTHGEPQAADQLRQRIERQLHWDCYVPDYRETVSVA
ncbi:MAG: MBL fold metallo-hydrolase RNA specificity domain-containing protein, partial [Hyphomicrobiaceae bacterium]